MKTLTWKDFKAFSPCYDPAEKYGEWSGTMLDLMKHPEIPDEDKIRAFTRGGIVSDKTLRLFAVACAREVQHLMTDERSLKALEVAEAFAHGKATEEELKAARDAAWDAAGAAAGDAARDAAWAAAGAAAGDAARDAAWAAAWAAWAALAALAARAARDEAVDAAWAAARDARDAARDAAWDESLAKQVEIAIELINKH